MSFPPLTWARHAVEWLGEKPKYQWTLGNNPLLGDKSIATFKLSRGARALERFITISQLAIGVSAAMAGGPLTLGVIVPLLFNAKMNGIVMGGVAQGVTIMSRFTLQAFDQIFNGPDEYREAEKYAKQFKKMKDQPGGVTPARLPQGPSSGPSVLDKMISLGHAFNGRAGQIPTPMLNTVIWGNNDQPQPQQPSQTYEEAFKIPSEDQIRVASSGRESVSAHNAHYGNPPPEHHHEPAPPPPAPKPPGCD